MADEETRPENNEDRDDKDSFSKFIDDNLNLDGMADAPNTPRTIKDDENINPPPSSNPFTSRFGKPPSGFSRFGMSKSDDDFDHDDDTNPFTGSTGFLSKKPPFGGDNTDRPSPFGGGKGSRFGSSDSGSRFGSGNRFGGNNDDNASDNPFGSPFGKSKSPPPPPSQFSALGRLSSNRQSAPNRFARTLPKSPAEKRADTLRKFAQIFKQLLPSILLLLLLIYFITIFSQYQPDVLKGEIQNLQQTITQQEAQIRQLQAQIEAMSRER